MNPQTARELKAAQYVLTYGTIDKPLVFEALEEMIERETDLDKIGALLKIKVIYEDLVVEWRVRLLTRTELNKWITEAMNETDNERVWSAAQFGAILIFTDRLKDKLQEEGLLDDS